MRLWVIDGGKALRMALIQTFGVRSLIQRWQAHRRRNVLEPLPEDGHASVRQALKDVGRYRTPCPHVRLATIAHAMRDALR